jgi:hypothetical protein
MKETNSDGKTKDRLGIPRKPWGKRLKQCWQRNQWLLWIIGIPAVFCFGYFGFRNSLSKEIPILDILYQILQLFVLNMDSTISNPSWQLEIARWLASFIAGYTALKALGIIFREQLQLLRIRFFLNDHIIICGLGTKGLLLSRKFIENRYSVVIIELDEENNNINECRDNGAIVILGNATVFDYLKKAGLKKAKYLLSVCGDDRINAEIAVQARNYAEKKRNKPLTTVVHIIDSQLCRLLKEREFETEKVGNFRLEFLNLFDRSAQILTETYPPFGKEKEEQTLSPHLLIVGAGRMGEALLVHAAQKWLKLPISNNSKFKISIIDKEAEKKKNLFYLRYPQLEKICELLPLEMDINSAEFESGRFLIDDGKFAFSIIYICFNNDSFALSTALALHQRLRANNVPIIIRMNRETGLATLIKGDTYGLGRLHAFGYLDRVLKPKLILMGSHEIIAQIIHEEYISNQFKKGNTWKTKPSMVPWEELSETLKESNRRQSNSIGVELKQIGCYIIPMID